jgi:hypothetical protein
MGYNGEGLRAWKKDASGNRTWFLYDGEDPVCELDDSGSVTAESIFGPAGLISRHAGSGRMYRAFEPAVHNARDGQLTRLTHTPHGPGHSAPVRAL